MNIFPVILAGGEGTRLWPLSRADKPKQFHNLSGEGSLLSETIKRLLPLKPEKIVVVTSKLYDEATKNELSNFDLPGHILAEPSPKNTANATLYASIFLSKLAEDSVMIVLPSDHHVKKTDIFLEVINRGIDEAVNNKLVTIGIRPKYPEIGYGYIKGAKGNKDVLPVDMFVEKPDIETAKKYILDGNYFWNSGIFIWKTSVILNNFKNLMPSNYKAFAPLIELSPEEIISNDEEIWKLKKKIFSSLDSISLDYGILEKAKKRVVIPCNFGWADLGSWQAVDDILEADDNENRTPEKEKVIFLDSRKCSVFTENKRVVVLGLENVVVVDSGDNILVMKKSSSQDVKKVVEIVREMDRK